MKNIRLIAIVIISVILIIIISVAVKQNSVENSFSIEELKQLMERYGENSPIVAEYLDKHKSSEELEKQIIILRNKMNSDSYKYGSKKNKNNVANNSNDKKNSGSLNNSSNNQFASDDKNSSYSDYLDDAKPSDELTDENTSTNSSADLQALQNMLDNLPSRSNDFIVKLDRDINGLEINVTGREARVSADLLNSDLFENGAFSNAPGIWITGLDKYKDPLLFESLWEDYKGRFIEVPGHGYYLLRDNIAPDSEKFIELKINILKDALDKSENPADKLYHQLARAYAEEAGDIEKAVQILGKYGKDKPDYDYRIAETYRLASESTGNDEQKQQYLNDAIQHYENLKKNSDNTNIRQWSDLRLGEAYAALGDTEKAISTLEQAYWNLPESKVPLCEHSIAYNLGNYHLKEDNYDDAIEWYDRVLHNETFKNKHKAEAYKEKGDYESAIRCYEAVANSKKKDVYSLSQSGILHAKRGDYDQAQQAFSKIQNRLKMVTQKKREKIVNSSYYQELKTSIR